MNQAFPVKIVFFLLLLGPIRAVLAQTPCTTPPNTQAMDRVFYDNLINRTKSEKIRIAVFPFQDGGFIGDDPTLASMFPLSLYEFLTDYKETGVYHPFLTVGDKTLTNNDLFDDDKMLEAAKKLGATHVVYGMFQKQPQNTMRFFIKIKDVEKNQSLTPPLEYAGDIGDRYFSIIADAASDIARLVFKEKTRPKGFDFFLTQHVSFEAFRFFAKGMEASSHYNDTSLEIAKVWFEKATSLSYQFTRGFEERARTLLMQALIIKVSGKNFAQLYGEGVTLIPNTGKNVKASYHLSPKRWTESGEAYVSGLTMMQSNAPAEAKTSFTKAATLVPEDAMAWYNLSKVGDGNALAKARELSSCF
ncbi:hypothetical protein K1X76_08300 [bacterium]|nr:hypothetical protein [bacterium]